MFSQGFHTLIMHQVNGYDHLALGSELDFGDENGPARIYAERSYFFDDTVYVGDGADKSVLPWLREVGLAPREIIEIPNRCIFSGLIENKDLLDELSAKVNNGARIQFFRTTQLESRLLQTLEIPWSKTLSCDPAIAEKMADKSFIRKLAAEKGEETIFPPHIILPASWNEAQVQSALWRVSAMSAKIGMKGVLIKRADLAGGDGIYDGFGKNPGDLRKANAGSELIVEAWINPHTSLSGLWFIHDGKALYIGTSRQIQSGFVHVGDLIGSRDDAVPDHVVNRLKRLAQVLLDHAVSLGYSGFIGIDAVYHAPTDRVWLTEVNARITSAVYAYALAARLDTKPWAIANKIIKPKKGLSQFACVKELLHACRKSYLLFNTRRSNGIVPYMLSGLRLPESQRRLGLMSIGDYPATAEHFLAEAEVCLSE